MDKWANALKPFLAVITFVQLQAIVFVTNSHIHPSLFYKEPYQAEPP